MQQHNSYQTVCIPIDICTNQFCSEFVLPLVNRVDPNQFRSTIDNCSSILQKHIPRISRDSHKMLVFLTALSGVFLLLAFIALVIVFVIPHEYFWLPVIPMPFFMIIPMVVCFVSSKRNDSNVRMINFECKMELERFLRSENDSYYLQCGVQWILRYDMFSDEENAENAYNHLGKIPYLELLIMDRPMVHKNPQNDGSKLVQQDFGQPIAVYNVEQEPNGVIYQQQEMNSYEKENDQEQLL
ncbi:predicted protein [Naegleria gruberi]|uniref:Predicted protein n=1 Tax=Naegleria gruberi TaxID=5762 RepID=D2VMJ3_NAEGR|nr:uncharacterized protein NAEGRDRAFT_70156 [Naegleria gruberi]EFC41997.1 predicted protein [Naegleria gruberi]|eukprot:XP_002674741.1 predicted protein [Naegleria gruberi strain NEG-M]